MDRIEMGLALVVVLSLLGGALLLGSWRRRTRSAWQRAAELAGLTYRSKSAFALGTIQGRLNGLSVSVEVHSDGTENRTTFTVDTEGAIPTELEIKVEGPWAGIRRMVKGGDIAIGDKYFDELAHISGDEAVALVGVNETTLEPLTAFLSRGGVLSGGTLRYEAKGILDDPYEIDEQLGLLCALGAKLVEAFKSPSTTLADNALCSARPAFRVKCLRALAERHPTDTTTSQALHHALGDSNEHVRLFAAASLRNERSLEVLRGLAESAYLSDELRTRALREVVRGHPRSNALPFVRAALSSDRDGVRAEAARLLGSVKDLNSLDALVPLCLAAEPSIARAAAWALAEIGDSRAEETLLTALDHPSDSVRVEAVRGLGLFGSIGAVERLFPFRERPFVDAELKQAAREAILRIQARLGQGDAGRLSVAEHSDKDGALSLGGDGGEVSVAEGPVPTRTR